MIKLEDLKSGDIIYKAYKYFWMMEYRVAKPKHQFIVIDKIKYYSATLKHLDGIWEGDKSEVYESDEKYLFRTKKEAKDAIKESYELEKEYLLKDNNFLLSLYDKAISCIALVEADRKLYKEVMEIIEKRNENGKS